MNKSFHSTQPPIKPSAAEGVHPAVSPDPKPASAVPFNSHAHTLPSGTLLTVQLQNSLSAAEVRDGDTFTASVAAPLTIDGDPLIERGTVATGHVESVRSQAGSGYFQLTLSALTVEGRPLALQTSSLFARGTLQPSDGVRVQKGTTSHFPPDFSGHPQRTKISGQPAIPQRNYPINALDSSRRQAFSDLFDCFLFPSMR